MRKFLIFTFLFCVIFPVGVFADSLEISVEDNEEIAVKISSDFEFSALSFELEYNKAALEFASNEFSETLDAAIPMINPSYSENSVKISILSAKTVAQGEICEIKFNKKSQKYHEIVLKLKNMASADLNGNIIEVTSSDKQLTIGEKESYHGGGSGGSSGGSSKPSTPSAPEKPAVPVQPEKPEITKEFKFKDVKATDWYYEAVKFAFEKGITSGMSEALYAPEDTVTRGQFVTMLCRAYDIKEMTGNNFSDCGNTWYTGYLAAAKQLGISNGVGDNKFEPEKEITREEMVTLIYNYLKPKNEAGTEIGKTGFADDNAVSDWAKAAVRFAVDRGYVNGKGNNMFDPDGKATRAELANIFFNILK